MNLDQIFRRFAAGSAPGPASGSAAERVCADRQLPCRRRNVVGNVRRGQPLRGQDVDLRANPTLVQDARLFA